MYFTQDIAARIKHRLKIQHKSMKDMLCSIGLGINAISEFSKGKQLSCISLANIADYLNCSVDYLLGRTDDPTFIPRKTVVEIPKKETPSSDAYIAAHGGAVHAPEEEKTPEAAREIFRQVRNEEN